ncbi:Leucine-rich repeat-containing protein [Cynara cardunculus var. scolymus]|uniref:Leucine-rich repeat-containing protein n=1 Tax=Cynara cardunculus var. scolymus TaxID=59895 RepID=A0A124SHM9_CYNCS|nr:Leucine-rich repeat-containing protein [Cynara cardunculus var. scolymus]
MKSFMLFWLLIVLALCSNRVCDGRTKRALCIESERLALLQFKHDLIDGANRLASWNTANIGCCRWYGIVCDNFTGHVQELHLRGPDPELEEVSIQMLAGKINPSLLSLKQLKYLDLSCNDFEATRIPSFFGSFQNLEYLNLSMSQFYGPVPYQLGNLSMLVALDLREGRWLGNVRIKSLDWLSGLPLLQHLDMSGYDLRSVSNWLQVINTLPSLVELHLSSCHLSQIPYRLSEVKFTSLTILDLSYNIFDSLMPGWIFTLNKLVSLDLSSCFLHGPSPGNAGGFHNMTDLKFLLVPENDFMNSFLVLRGLLSLTGLVSLDISTCNISTSILGGLQNMTSLVSIDLARNQIVETFPNSFGNLCNLIYIEIRDNYISGSISEIINSFSECKSPKLEHLGFSTNGFSGSIPYRLGKLQNLVTLDLAFNHISGTLPDSLGRLSFLRKLILNVNSISGLIPDSLGNLTSLEWLEISFNNFNGTLPESVGQLGKLTYLSVHHNSLTGVLTEDHFTNLTSLKTLWADANMLTLELSVDNWVPPFQLDILRIGSWNLGPNFPSWLQSQRNLMNLDIANAGISDIVPSWFWISFSDILFLNVSHNNIRGMLIGNLSILVPEAVVDLSDNQFEGPLPGTFNEVDILLLDVSNNNLSGSLEMFLCPSLKKDRQLKVLDLANNNLSGIIPDCWTNWQALSVVNFENNGLSGELPQSVGSLSSLQSLDIRNNKLFGKLPASLLNLKSLQIIDLAENEFTGSIPLLIDGEETKLKLVSLRSNKLEGEIPDELCRLTSIQILDLAHNNLSGTLPTCFHNFSLMSGRQNSSEIVLYDLPFQVQVLGSASLVTKGREFEYSTILYLVTTLDLSGNKFSGPIPKELVGLLGLRWLNLSGNHLTGRIPEAIGNMALLESLDLSVNQLDGRIPWSMSRLTKLSWLSISCNKLTGEIPTSTQLQSFNESSFMANTLCGPPLAEVCNKKKVSNRGSGEVNGDGVDWGFIISILVGFIIAFWAVVAPLIANKVWRSAYFYFLYKVWFKIRITYRKCFFNMPPN